MRFQTVAAGETWSVLGRFPTGRTVSCAIFNAETGAAISQASTTTAEIGATGLFHYDSDQLTTAPVVFTIIAWQMTDASTGATDEGVIAVGGHVDNVNATISSRATPAQVATELATYDGPTHAELIADGDVTQAAIAALAIPTAGQNADAVWDEARAGHVAVGTYGQFTGDAAMRGTDGANTIVPLAAATDQAEHDATQAAIAALPAAPAAGVIADAVWDEDLTGHTTLSTGGGLVRDIVFEDRVYVSSTGTAGTGLYIGTAARPVSNLTDAITIAQARGVNVFHILSGSHTITAGNATGLNSIGAVFKTDSTPVMSLSSTTTLNGISFEGTFTVGGPAGAVYNSCRFQNCKVSFDTNRTSSCLFDACTLFGTLTKNSGSGGANTFRKCYGNIPGGLAPEFVCDGQNTGGFFTNEDTFENFNGYARILNVVSGSIAAPEYVFALLGGLVDIDASVTSDARIFVSGIGVVLNSTTFTDTRVEIPTTVEISDGVWDEASAGHVAGGSFGAEVQTHATAAEVAAALVTYDGATQADLTAAQVAIIAAITALNDVTASAVATAVWDSLRSSHATTGTMGRALTILLNSMVSRGLINTATTPWQEVRYVFDEASAGDATPFETFELYDQAGVAIAGSAVAGNNPLFDPTRIIAERRRV